jgi:hypothetical protein
MVGMKALEASSYYLLLYLLHSVIQPDHVIVTTNVPVKRIAARLEGT